VSNRAEDAARFRQAVAANPADRVAWHNLAAAEGDIGRAAESAEAARKAIALGIAAPETRLVLARALQSLRQLDEAERAFEEAISLRPAYAEAHRDLAQLLWMRTGDADASLARLEAALRAAPAVAGLHHARSIVREFAGDAGAALDAALEGLRHVPDDVELLRQAAHLELEAGRFGRGLELAQRAAARAPGTGAEASVCEAFLASGRAREAAALAEFLCGTRPHDQYFAALQCTAWRLLGDPRYAAAHDYARLVSTERLDVPAGWATLEAFLADLAAELEGLHAYRAHPLQQSVRGGSQVHLQAAELDRAPIAALFRSIAAAVQRHVARLGRGDGPLLARNTGRFAFSGAWSVRLRSGGHHADHVHPHGWISSACYIALPPGVGRGEGDRAGWLRLGKPAIPTRPPLAADHYVKPEAGLLVLFPAYVWHGVEPFTSDQPRLSVAFDVVPQ
jgi:uncharacterized protein (TIGR02466 family)